MPSLEDLLAGWKSDLTAQRALFSEDELRHLDEQRRTIPRDERTIVYFVFENPFAKSGGIFAVASHLPRALREAGERVVLVSPFHRNLRTTPSYDQLHFRGDLQVPFMGRDVKTELFEHQDLLGNSWLLMQSWGIFDADGGPGRTNPYAYPISWLLLRDALFAAAALPQVLAHVELRSNLLIHAQDWQCAPAALTVKEAVLRGDLQSAAVLLTSHNPYDHALPSANLSWITNRLSPAQWPLGDGTVYQRMIPITDAPVSTVSPGFAAELTHDPLQTRHFTKHLQGPLGRQTVVGIDNPLFGEPRCAFSDAAMREAAAGLPDRILQEKLAKRRALLNILAGYRDDRIIGGLDGGPDQPLGQLPDETPIFMMFGRMDPGQKGFDLFCRAIEGFDRNEAKFILTPIVGDGQQAYLDDFHGLAWRREGDVAIYPFRMERGYLEAMSGANFAVMPSFYEPFGAATEAYLNGTPVIARATGGLTGQVVDFDKDPARATGFLFREKLPLGALWPDIQAAASPEERVRIPLYAAMAEALYDGLRKGEALWRNRRSAYGRMLANLFPQAASFSGDRAACGYRALYDRAVSPESRLGE